MKPDTTDPVARLEGLEAVRVTAADWNGHTWDGSPFDGYDTLPAWLNAALAEGRIQPVNDHRDYAVWQVLTNDYGKPRWIAEPGDWIVNFAGNLAVLSDRALPALLAAVREGEWRPIESAPKDESQPLLLAAGRFMWIGQWSEDEYARKPNPYWRRHGSFSKTYDRAQPPTHWRPLPSPPTLTNTEGSNGS